MNKFAVINFARDESNKLQYHILKLNTKRKANYRYLIQNVNNNNFSGSSHWEKVILSSSYYGCVRCYRNKNMESLLFLEER